jgi:hypothetical protein
MEALPSELSDSSTRSQPSNASTLFKSHFAAFQVNFFATPKTFSDVFDSNGNCKDDYLDCEQFNNSGNSANRHKNEQTETPLSDL